MPRRRSDPGLDESLTPRFEALTDQEKEALVAKALARRLASNARVKRYRDTHIVVRRAKERRWHAEDRAMLRLALKWKEKTTTRGTSND